MTTATRTGRYSVVDVPANGAAGQDCGVFDYAELPERIRAAIAANPDAGKWVLPALSDGDSGDELAELSTVVSLVSE